MAEGVIIVLLGEERLKKYFYTEWLKNYEFDIVFGISTDSYDGLGFITDIEISSTLNKEVLEKVTKSFIGAYTQKVPPLSTKKIKGKHLHEYFRSGKSVELPEKKGEIYEINLLNLKDESTEEIIRKIIRKIFLISGDFRQKYIVKSWNKSLKGNKLPQKITVAKLGIKTSKGIYVRSLATDISTKLGTIGFANSIIRTKNGRYGKKECKTLEKIFGINFKTVYDFESKYKITMVK